MTGRSEGRLMVLLNFRPFSGANEMVDFNDGDQARGALRQALLTLLRLGAEKGTTPEDLRERRLGVNPTRTPKNGAALTHIRNVNLAIEGLRDQERCKGIVSDAIDEACSIFQIEKECSEEARHATVGFGGDALFGATVDRRQFAVGHGGFHAGRIQVMQSLHGLTISTLSPKGEYTNTIFDQSYVYDCGSEDAGAFARAKEIYDRDYATRLELLFVSHLHADHISELDKILGKNVPRIVVLPYLDLEDLACMALRDYEDGKFPGSYREYLRDPVSWWRSRGVETVIFIEPGDDAEGLGETASPDRPLDRGADLKRDEWDYSHPQARLAAVLKKPLGTVPVGLTAANPQADPDARKLGKPALLAGSGSYFRLEWRHDPRDSWRSADWGLVPYVHPVKDVQREAFRKALMVHLDRSDLASATFEERVLKELTHKDEKHARQLVDL